MTDDPARIGWMQMGTALAVVWVAVRGVEPTAIRLAEELAIGVAVGLPTAYAGRRFYGSVTGLDPHFRRLPYAVLYFAAFVWELVTANVDVARRVLAPSLPIDPDVVEVPLRVESDLAVTTIANSITLTPGTLTMDYDRERNALYVHSIDGSDRAAVVEPIRRWEDYALVVFEPLKPGDPVPDPDARAVDGATDGGPVPDPDARAVDGATDGGPVPDPDARAVDGGPGTVTPADDESISNGVDGSETQPPNRLPKRGGDDD